MTKSQIKAELRRSACEDKDPWLDINDKVLDKAYEFEAILCERAIADVRIFFLLVSEAL